MKLFCFEIRYIGMPWRRFDEQLLALIEQDMMVNAVKLYRDRTGATLKDSLNYCKALRDKVRPRAVF